jgi:hypothetical protein
MISSTKTNWNKLKHLDDNNINYSDIPNTDLSFWDDCEVMIPQNKVDYLIKIDEDLALWLKSIGDNSNNILNNIIRTYYLINNNLV